VLSEWGPTSTGILLALPWLFAGLRRFAEIRTASPWLLLNSNAPEVGTGPNYPSALGAPCPSMPVVKLQIALTAAGWRLALEEYGYQIWSAEPEHGEAMRHSGHIGDQPSALRHDVKNSPRSVG
jgi:hypothetical protein